MPALFLRDFGCSIFNPLPDLGNIVQKPVRRMFALADQLEQRLAKARWQADQLGTFLKTARNITQ